MHSLDLLPSLQTIHSKLLAVGKLEGNGIDAHAEWLEKVSTDYESAWTLLLDKELFIEPPNVISDTLCGFQEVTNALSTYAKVLHEYAEAFYYDEAMLRELPTGKRSWTDDDKKKYALTRTITIKALAKLFDLRRTNVTGRIFGNKETR